MFFEFFQIVGWGRWGGDYRARYLHLSSFYRYYGGDPDKRIGEGVFSCFSIKHRVCSMFLEFLCIVEGGNRAH